MEYPIVVVDLEFRIQRREFFLNGMQGVLTNFGVPCPLPVITSETTATCHVDLGKFPFYNFIMKENEAIENHRH